MPPASCFGSGEEPLSSHSEQRDEMGGRTRGDDAAVPGNLVDLSLLSEQIVFGCHNSESMYLCGICGVV